MTSEPVSRETSGNIEEKAVHKVEIAWCPATIAFEVFIDGRQWGYLSQLDLMEAGISTMEGVQGWGKRVVRELLECFRRGDDVWAPAAVEGQRDLLLRIAHDPGTSSPSISSEPPRPES